MQNSTDYEIFSIGTMGSEYLFSTCTLENTPPSIPNKLHLLNYKKVLRIRNNLESVQVICIHLSLKKSFDLQDHPTAFIN